MPQSDTNHNAMQCYASRRSTSSDDNFERFTADGDRFCVCYTNQSFDLGTCAIFVVLEKKNIILYSMFYIMQIVIVMVTLSIVSTSDITAMDH